MREQSVWLVEWERRVGYHSLGMLAKATESDSSASGETWVAWLGWANKQLDIEEGGGGDGLISKQEIIPGVTESTEMEDKGNQQQINLLQKE